MSTPLSLDALITQLTEAAVTEPHSCGYGDAWKCRQCRANDTIAALVRNNLCVLTGRLVPQAWQPIALGPKDGTEVMVGFWGVHGTGWVTGISHWHCAQHAHLSNIVALRCPDNSLNDACRMGFGSYDMATHFMALPPPPLRPGEPR